MNRFVARSGAVVVAGAMLIMLQGCGTKWVQSDGEQAAPPLSNQGSGGELRGFSRNPPQERVTGDGSVPGASSMATARRSAERTKEELEAEQAAAEAGLQDVFFGYDEWTVSPAGIEALDRDAAYLKDHPDAVLRVEGHCDERGTSAYNLVLGDKRAKAVRRYLVESGVGERRIVIVSLGKERPFCFDHDEACYQQNRRGHMLLNLKR